LKLFVLAAAWIAAASAGAQEMVTLQTRPGVTQSFFIAGMGKRAPEAAALLFIGGGGAIDLRMEGGQVRFQQGNFLPRARREFIRNGILPVILDNPSDQKPAMTDEFRASSAHASDIRAVVAEMKKRYPRLPVFVIGTSRSTLSAAHLGARLDKEIAGVVLTASLFYSDGRTMAPRLVSFDWSKIGIPVLVVHHWDDGCPPTPYREAARLEKRYPLVTVRGGKPPQGPACEPFSQHGFFGREAETVDAIAAWMRGKPFPKEIR
jgi:pimeloyl-ACP methyl ester carboxylesterase